MKAISKVAALGLVASVVGMSGNAMALTCGTGQTLKRFLIQDAPLDATNDSLHVVGKQGDSSTIGSNTCSQNYDVGLADFDGTGNAVFTSSTAINEQVTMFLDSSNSKPARMPYSWILSSTKMNPGKKAVSVTPYDPAGVKCTKDGISFIRVEVCFID